MNDAHDPTVPLRLAGLRRSIALAAGGLFYAAGAAAVGELLPVGPEQFARCRLEHIDNGSYQGTEHRYTGRGSCAVFAYTRERNGASTFDNERLIETRRWSFDGHFSHATQKAIERITFDRLPSEAQANQLTSTMQCSADPWLGSARAAVWCHSPFYSDAGSPQFKSLGLAAHFQKSKPRWPFTASFIGEQTRERLLAEFKRVQTIERSTAGSVRDAASMRQGAAIAGAGTAVGPLGAPAARTTDVQRPPGTTTSVSGSAGSVTKLGTPVVPGDTSGVLAPRPNPLTRAADGVQTTTDVPMQRAGATAPAASAVTPPVAAPAAARPDASLLGGRSNAAERQGLNPQPLPPKQAQAKGLDKVRQEQERRGLNPQPLPPKESSSPRSAFERTP